MTESADKSNEELASALIVSTCQLLPKSLPVSDYMHNVIWSWGTRPGKYLIVCGSLAEFYIQPLNACIDDVDYLISQTDHLAFSGNIGEFFELPNDMSGLADTIECLKIEPCHRYPGFVRLRFWGKMNYNWKNKNYEFKHTTRTKLYGILDMTLAANEYSLLRHDAGKDVCGPAIKRRRDMPVGISPTTDFVESIGCPQWPKEAQDWFKRPRNNGWPTIDTISEIEKNGCHVVYVQHRSCRDDKQQWRLSFSFAEVILLQSWTQTQQIIYHLLRFFAKTELIQNDCPKEDEVLCTYHLKTLMLWTCEEMSSEWWNSSSVIVICCEMLKKLSEWLKKRHCPNYFIPEANLFHEPSSCSTIVDETERRITRFRNSKTLCDWFVENYIESFIRRHFKLKSTMVVMPHLVFYTALLLEFWKELELESLDYFIFTTFTCCHKNSRPLIKNQSNSGLRQSLSLGCYARLLHPETVGKPKILPTIQTVSCFASYDNELFILHTAYGLGCGEISWDSSLFVEFVNAISLQPKNLISQFHNFPKAYTAHSNHFQFLRAQDLMKHLTGSNSRSEFQLLSLMSKEFLRKALEHDDSISNGIAPAALAYLAALHFATSEYQQTIRVCFAVLAYRSPQKDKETLNAGCLLFIDDVARIIGLCVLHKKITSSNLYYINRRLFLDLRLSPEVLAYYLAALSAKRMYKHLDLYYDYPNSVFRMDEYWKALIKPQCINSMKSSSNFNATRQIVYCRPDSLTETEDTDLNHLIVKEKVIDVLVEYALENVTSFYNVICKDFGMQLNAVDCYRALYLYKCRQYDQAMYLCERILQEPDLEKDLKKFSFANVVLLPPLDSYFDRDVQTLLGFHTLFYYLSPTNNDMGKIELNDESTFEHWFARDVYSSMRELLFVLNHDNDYSIKCHYFLGRHFLARYLKLKCCIDCNLPLKEAMTEFALKKPNLPFERIIWSFLLHVRKLHIIKNSSRVAVHQ